MTQEELEGNRLIAEFDGYKIDNSFPDKNRVYRKGNSIELDTTLKYHFDRNLQDDIINKIIEITIPDSPAHYYWIDAESDIRIFRESKEITFEEIVKFIKWYNQNK